MRDKLIALILEAQGVRLYYCIVGEVDRIFEMEYRDSFTRRCIRAELIADALIAAGVVPEWVSVEDGLPDDGEYLVRVKFGGRSFTSIASFAHSSQTLSEMERYGIGDKQDFWYADDCEYGVGEQLGVTHWCKFPAPPKEE